MFMLFVPTVRSFAPKKTSPSPSIEPMVTPDLMATNVQVTIRRIQRKSGKNFHPRGGHRSTYH